MSGFRDFFVCFLVRLFFVELPVSTVGAITPFHQITSQISDGEMRSMIRRVVQELRPTCGELQKDLVTIDN